MQTTRRTSGPQTYCSCGAHYASSTSAERRHMTTVRHREWYAKTYGDVAAAAAFGMGWNR